MDAVDARRMVIVDDETLEVVGYRIRATGNARGALRWLEDEPCELLITDVDRALGPSYVRV